MADDAHSWLKAQQLPKTTALDNEWRNVSLDRIRDELEPRLVKSRSSMTGKLN